MGASPGVSLAVGGGGGNPFTLNCPDGKVLVGIRGRAGSFIDSIRGVCKRFDEIGNGTGTETTALVGGTGGTSNYELRCPSGEVVVGLKARAAWLVDRLQIVCGAINEDGRVQGDGHTDPFTAGGTGGDQFSLMCPHPVGQSFLRLPVVGLKGRADSWLDNISIICGFPTVDQLAPVDPNRPDLRVSVRGLPFRVRAGETVEYTTIMRNVGTPRGAGAELDLATEFPISFPIIEVPFLAQGGCDVHDIPPPPVFVRCTAGGTDGNWGVSRSQ